MKSILSVTVKSSWKQAVQRVLRIAAVAVLAWMVLGGPKAAQADQVGYTNQLAYALTPWTNTLAFPQFDPALGSLTQVTFYAHGIVTGYVKLENTSTSSGGDYTASIYGSINLELPDGQTLQTSFPVQQYQGSLGIYDGILDYAGTSGVTYPTIIAEQGKITVFGPGEPVLATMVGTNQIVLKAFALGGSAVTITSGNSSIRRGTRAAADIMAIYYDYSPAGPIENPMFCGLTSATVCEGETGNLALTINAGVAPFTVTVTAPDGGPSSFTTSESSALIAASQAGNYKVEVQDASGHASSCFGNLLVRSLPQGVTINGSTGPFDPGTTGHQLIASGLSTYQYQWSILGAMGSGWQITGGTNSQTMTFTAGISNAVFSLQVSDLFGCQKSYSFLITAKPLSSLGNFVWYDANANGIQDQNELVVPGVSVNLYDGTGTNLLSSTATDNNGFYSFPNLKAGSYQVEFIRPNGYVFTTPLQGGNVQLDSDADQTSGRTPIINLPVSTDDNSWDAGIYIPISASLAANPSAVCAGQSATLTLQITGGLAPYTVTVTGPGGAVISSGSTSATSQQWTISAAGAYSATVTDAGGTVLTSGASLTVNDLPVCTLAVPDPLPVVGSTGNTLSGPAGLATYQWTLVSSTGPGWAITAGTTAQTMTYTAGAGGTATFQLSITNAAGCSSVCQVTFRTRLTANITASPAVVCSGNSSTLGLQVVGGLAPYTVTVTGPGGAVISSGSTSATSQQWTISAAGTYSATVTDAGGAVLTSGASLTVNAPPTCTLEVPNPLPTARFGGNNLSGPAGMATYQWTLVSGAGAGWAITDGATTDTLEYTAGTNGTATFQLAVTTAAGCSSVCQVTFGSTNPGGNDNTPVLTTSLSALPATVCRGTASTLSLRITGGLVPYTVTWAGPAGVILSGATSETNQQISASTAGAYTVTVVDARGVTNASTANLTVIECCVTKLLGTVYRDCNADGKVVGDAGLQGVTVLLKNSAGTLIGTTVTATDGTYAFTGMPAGTYTVSMAPLAGYSQTDCRTVTNSWIGTNGNTCWKDNDGKDHWRSTNGCHHWKDADGVHCWKDTDGRSYRDRTDGKICVRDWDGTGCDRDDSAGKTTWRVSGCTHWRDGNGNDCWKDSSGSIHRKDTAGNECWKDLSTGDCHWTDATGLQCWETDDGRRYNKDNYGRTCLKGFDSTKCGTDDSAGKSTWRDWSGKTHWSDDKGNDCTKDTSGCIHRKDSNGNECWTDRDGNRHRMTCASKHCWKTPQSKRFCVDQTGRDCTDDLDWSYCDDDDKDSNCQPPTAVVCDHTVTVTNCQTAALLNFALTGTLPAVSVVVTAPASAVCGGTVTYTIAVTNTGNTCFSGGLSVISSLLGGQVFNTASVAPGQGFVITTNYVIGASDASPLANTVTAIGQPAIGNAVTAQSSVTTQFTPCPKPLCSGDTATIGYWNNCNGQALIKSLNGSCWSTALGNWLASSFPCLYGASSSKNLAGKSNYEVASLFQTYFDVCGTKTDAQTLAVALAIYVTDSDLAGTTARSCGFNISTTGTGAKSYNVGSYGLAIGLSNNTSYPIAQLLQQANARKQAGTFNATAFNCIFDGINTAGDRL